MNTIQIYRSLGCCILAGATVLPLRAQGVVDFTKYDPSYRSESVPEAATDRSGAVTPEDSASEPEADLINTPGAVAAASRQLRDNSGGESDSASPADTDPPLPTERARKEDEVKPVELAADTSVRQERASRRNPPPAGRNLVLSLRDLDQLKRAANMAGGDLRVAIVPVGITTAELVRHLTASDWFEVSVPQGSDSILVKTRDPEDSAALLASEVERLKLQKEELEKEIDQLRNLKTNLAPPPEPIPSSSAAPSMTAVSAGSGASVVGPDVGGAAAEPPPANLSTEASGRATPALPITKPPSPVSAAAAGQAEAAEPAHDAPSSSPPPSTVTLSPVLPQSP